jgi:tetratricopeptide (TPR) repeat protein
VPEPTPWNGSTGLPGMHRIGAFDVFETGAAVDNESGMAGAAHPLSGAITSYLARLKEAPGDRDAYKTLEGLLIQTGDWAKLAEVCELVADGVKLPKDRLQYYVRAGGLNESKLGDEIGATRCYAKALGLAPGEPEALAGFLRILGGQGQWSSVLSTLASSVGAVTEPRRKAELLVESARIRAANLDDVGGAFADLRRAIVEDAQFPKFREVSESILGAKQAWEELAQLWRALAESLRDPVARSGILLDVAAILRDRLGHAADAAGALEEAAVGQTPGSKTLVEAAALYRQAGRWSDVLRLLDRERSVTSSRDRLLPLLTEIATIQEGPIGDPAAAADTWIALSKLNPDDRAVFDKVSAQLARAGRWEDLASLGSRALEREKDPARWRELALFTAKLYEERLGVQERAIKFYEELSRRDPADVEVIEALTRVYEARGRWADLAVTCERAAGLLGEVAGRQYLHHAASLHEFRLSRPDRAIALYRQLLGEDPGDEFAASALVRLYREQDDPGPLAEALAAFAKVCADPTTKRDALAERGTLLAGVLSDPIAALAPWKESLESDPDWEPGLHGLQDALRKAIVVGENAPKGSQAVDPEALRLELIEMLDRERKVTEEPGRRGAIDREAAAIHIARHAPAEARVRFEAARGENAEDLEAIEALAALYREAKMLRDEAATWRTLIKLRRSPKDRAAASFVLGGLYKVAHDEGTLFKIAGEEELEEDEPWIRLWKAATEEDPAHKGALKALIEHAEEQKDWDQAVLLLTQLASVVTDPHERAVLLTRAGEHLRVKLDDEVGAMAKYAAAVALSPRHLPAARPLADALFRSRRWAEAEPLYKRFGADLALESTPRGVAEAYWRGGVVMRELSREEDSVFQWRKAVEADATFTPALDDLAIMLRKRAEWRSAREVYAKILYLAVSRMDTERQVQAHRALAVIAEALHEPDEAIERYKKVTQLEPGDIDALTSLARLYVDAGRWREALDVYEQLLPYTGDPAQAAKIYVKRGEILAERLDDPMRAVDAYAAALAARSSVEVRYRLADALFRSRRFPEAAAERSKLADQEEDDHARIEHLIVLAQIRRDQLRDDAGAREAFERVLEIDAHERRSLVGLSALYEKAQMWEPLVRVLRTSAGQIPASRAAALSDLRTRIASILADKVENVVEAVGELRLALAASPDHSEALARMAALAPTDPAFDREALMAHHRLIQREPLRIESLRVLGDTYARGGRMERARLYGDLLSLMKSPSKQLAFVAEAARKRGPQLPGFALAPQDLSDKLPYPEEKGPILQIMRLLESASDRLYPPNLEEKGASSTDKLDPGKVPDPMSLPSTAFAFSRALGIPKLVIYRARASAVEVSIEPTRPPALLLGPGILAETAREAAHPVARALWYLAHGIPLLAKVKPEVYDRLVLAAIAAFLEPAASDRLADKAAAKKDDLLLVRRTIPRKKANEIKALAMEALGDLGDDPRAVVKTWRRRAQMGADRAALLLTGDVSGTVRRALGGGVPAEIAAREPARVAEIIRGSVETLELVRFGVSEEYFRMREALGFGGQGE